MKRILISGALLLGLSALGICGVCNNGSGNAKGGGTCNDTTVSVPEGTLFGAPFVIGFAGLWLWHRRSSARAVASKE